MSFAFETEGSHLVLLAIKIYFKIWHLTQFSFSFFLDMPKFQLN